MLLCSALTAAPTPAAEAPAVFAQLGHTNVVHTIAFSPNGHTLASGGEDGATKLWDLTTQRELRTLSRGLSAVRSVGFSPDGSRLAAGYEDGTLALWDVRTGRQEHVLRGHPAAVNSLAFSADGRTLASGSADHTVKLWSAETLSELRTLTAHHDAVTAVAFSPDGRLLASGSVDKTLRLWDPQSGHELHTLAGHADRLSALSFCPSGRVLASGSWDHTVKLWDPASGAELRTLRGHSSEVWSVACSADGATLASGGYNREIKLWDAASGRELRSLNGDPRWVESVAFSPSGHVLASAGADHSIKLWDVASGQQTTTLEGQADFVKTVAFSHNGRLLVSGSADHALRLWLLADGRALRTIPAHASWVGALAFSPDNRHVFSRGGDGAVKLVDLVSGAVVRSFAVDSVASGSTSLAISPDGRTLAAGGPNHSIRLWNTADGTLSGTWVGAAGEVESVAFSPDGRMLAAGDDHSTITLWSLASGRPLRTLHGHSSWVGSLAFSPDGRWLASGGGDRTVLLWDTASGQALRTLRGHSAPITSVAFAPEGAVLASSDESAAIKLWSAANGAVLHELRGHSDVVEAVTFSPDGKLLASASSDSTIRLWDAASGTERLSLIALRGDAGVLHITPQGYYDFEGANAEEHINVRVGDEVSGIGAYRERFYRPDLVRLALSGQSLPAALPTLSAVKPAPLVTLIDPPAAVDSEALDLRFRVSDRGGGVGEVRTLVNGAAVADPQGTDRADAAPTAAAERTVRLRLVSGSNDVQVIAFNADGSVHSNPAHVSVTAHYTAVRNPQLYALVVGIKDFDNPTFDLRYPVDDATAIADMLRRRAAPLFDKVNVESLTTPKVTSQNALRTAFKHYRTIDPGDVFLLYVASHGTVEGELAHREYFLIPSNVTSAEDDAVKRDALSASELRHLIAAIPATRKLLLFDTCYSGAMGDAMQLTTRLQQQASVGVLSSAVGSAVLSASTSDQEALEGQDGHGLFTWVLLQGLDGSADFRKRGYINTYDLADYVGDEVPKLAEQHFKYKQFPNLNNAGQSFAIVSSR